MRKVLVPFNDLSRIHLPMKEDFVLDLTQLIDSGQYVLGDAITEFEKELALCEQIDFSITLNSGTSALESLLRAAGIGEGDEVLVPAMTFVATVFSILQVGAIPVLVDVDPATGLMDLEKTKQSITGTVRAVLFVTLHGRVDYLNEFKELCDAHGLIFLLDSAQSHLGVYEGKSQASFALGAATSFYPGKNLGALGEGGAVLSNSKELISEIRLIRNWGSRTRYDHESFGGNYRLDTLQTCFLSRKLPLLQGWTYERKKIASFYDSKIDEKLRLSPVSSKGDHVYHIYAIRTRNRDIFAEKLRSEGIETGIHYPKAIHQQKYYKNFVKLRSSLSGSEEFAAQTLSIPIFPMMSTQEFELVARTVDRLGDELSI